MCTIYLTVFVFKLLGQIHEIIKIGIIFSLYYYFVSMEEEAREQLQQSLIKLEETQKILIESEKMASLGSLVSGVAHEINTPLAVIMTHIDLFKMKEGENRYLTKIEAASKIISNIYNDLSYMVKKNRFD